MSTNYHTDGTTTRTHPKMKTPKLELSDSTGKMIPCEIELAPANEHRIYHDGITKEWYIRAVFAVGPMPAAVEQLAKAKGQLIDNAANVRNALCGLIEQCHLLTSDDSAFGWKDTPLDRATKRARTALTASLYRSAGL